VRKKKFGSEEDRLHSKVCFFDKNTEMDTTHEISDDDDEEIIQDHTGSNTNLSEKINWISATDYFINMHLCPHCQIPVRLSCGGEYIVCLQCHFHRRTMDEFGKSVSRSRHGFKLSNDERAQSFASSSTISTTSSSSSSKLNSNPTSETFYSDGELALMATERPFVVKNEILGRNKVQVHPNMIVKIYKRLLTACTTAYDRTVLLSNLTPTDIRYAMTELNLSKLYPYTTLVYCGITKQDLPSIDYCIEKQSDKLYDHLMSEFRQHCNTFFQIHSKTHIVSYMWYKVWQMKSQDHLLKFIYLRHNDKTIRELDLMWKSFCENHQPVPLKFVPTIEEKSAPTRKKRRSKYEI
jgi:hypothetical protein